MNRLHPVALLVCIVAILAGIGFGIKTALFMSQAKKVDGAVVQTVKAPGKYDYKTSIAYTVEGKRYEYSYEFENKRPNMNPNPKAGEKMELLYHPKNPERAKPNRFGHTWLLPIALIFIGIATPFFPMLAKQ